ncbi:hypothetical protein RHMOL_Rhmol01G0224300 [Rhododendron molle]|uniref:Uncharacterized protein n=1 Tax=Rhododendron molle TaxID=49168 RepID=A0ACC0Q444_RHOML|nr:hypothetical protein RHMOL_Rhmol01G0224300 [Rhododendron molle]
MRFEYRDGGWSGLAEGRQGVGSHDGVPRHRRCFLLAALHAAAGRRLLHVGGEGLASTVEEIEAKFRDADEIVGSVVSE